MNMRDIMNIFSNKKETPKEPPKVVIKPNGDKEYWVNGKLHREDGPAIEYIDGGKEWHRNGKLHREDGPAIESGITPGHKEWYLNGKKYTFIQYLKKLGMLNDDNKAMIIKQLLTSFKLFGRGAGTSTAIAELEKEGIHWPELNVIKDYVGKLPPRRPVIVV